jgi:formate hydrogenlyase transcriptional activator
MSEHASMSSETWNARAVNRYRTLLKLSAAITGQPNSSDMLRSVHQHLSDLFALDGVILIRLEEGGKTAQLLAWDQKGTEPKMKLGARIEIKGSSIEKAMAEMEPIFIPDLNQMILAIPQLAGQAHLGQHRCAYVFPIATPRVQWGVLVFASVEHAQFSGEDVELMASATSQVAVALESEMAMGEVARYRQQLEEERDRLGLLLDINNQVIAKKKPNELFQSASKTILKYFGNDCAGFWLRDGESHQFDCAVLDFPTRIGSREENPVIIPAGEDLDRMEDGIPRVYTEEEIEGVSAPALRALKTESIRSLITAPLVTAQGVAGIIALGSRQPRYFTQADLDLLRQVEHQLALALDNAIAYGRLDAFKNRLQDEKLYLESEIRAELKFEDIVGDSPALRKVLEQVSVVAPTRSTVLLLGETGTGKELIARAIHNASPRRERTFVKLNCAAIPSALVESELFGHEKGAFTGALGQKRGRFDVADQGTLFLDEVGDIALELQPKLLRAIQEQEFERLGSNRSIRVDVRLVAATHRDLPAMIRDGQFRQDLFYRLNVFPIEIPPLRERREDIPMLVHYFVSRHSREMRKAIHRIPRDAMDALTNASWPGNVRELENFLERAVILTRGEDLEVPINELAEPVVVAVQAGETALPTMRESERKAILAALKASGGKVAGSGGAAERLGLKRSTLRSKMKRLNIGRTDD